MLTANLPKSAKAKITAEYVQNLERENEELLRKVVQMREAIIGYTSVVKMYPKYSYEVEQAKAELDNAMSCVVTGGKDADRAGD